MAIKQKRSLVTGSIPTTASLAIGELAMNIPDGRIFFRKSGSGSDTVQSAITTGAQNSGSVVISGSLSLYASTGSVLDISGDIFEISGDVIEISGDTMEFTGSFTVTGSSTVTGSLRVTNGITGSLLGTSSWANNAITASYIFQAISSSFASTASSADNFTVRNTLTAQTIVVQTITSSIDFVTGSTRFGSLTSNTHLFTGSVGMTGSLTVVGPVNATSFTGSILGTASYATNADTLDGNHASAFVLNSQTSSMSVATASFVNLARSASYVLQAVSASFATLAQTANTASFVTTAQTASYVLQAVSASFATSASQAISSSFATNADTLDGNHASAFVLNSQTSSMSVATASFVTTAQTASYVLQAVSASFTTLSQTANTASYVLTAQTASFVNLARSASYVLQAVSASFATNADTVDGIHASAFVLNSQTSSMSVATASYVLQAVSASFATSASRAISSSFASNADTLDGAHLSILATTGSNIFRGNQIITGSINITGSDLTLTNSGNTQATITATNTTAGAASAAQINVISTNGGGQIQKRSSSTITYKILTPNNLVLYNDTAGDIAILNDAAGGNIKFAANGASVPQLFLSGSGRVGIGTTVPTDNLHVVGTSFLNGNVTLGDGVYFDDLNNRLGIGVSSPTQVLDVAAPFAIAKLTNEAV